MARTIDRLSASSLVYIVMYLFFIIFLIFMFIRTPFTNPLVLLPVILSALMFYVTAYGQFIPILINPNFQSDSGVIGTYYSGPHTYHGGQEGYKVALFKWDIPDNLDRANKGLSGSSPNVSCSIIFDPVALVISIILKSLIDSTNMSPF